MNVQIKRIILLLWMLCPLGHAVFSQTYSSRDNYTGAWETPASWNPIWTVPQTSFLNGANITINGFLTVNGSLSFSGTAGNLIINDTLVIKGNLLLENNTQITINDNGILIVRGNITITNQAILIANGYLIVSGDISIGSSPLQGLFTSNDNPVKIFIGGNIFPIEITDNNPNFPVLNCTAPITTQYSNSMCSYGNMTDILSDPINFFFQYTCKTANVKRNISVCAANTINLTSSSGTTYIWNGPNGFTSNIQNPNIPNATAGMAGVYTITVIAAPGCIDTDTINLIVTALPPPPTITTGGPITFCTGGSVTLTSSAGTNYLWSNGATTQGINIAASGSYTVRVTDASGCLSEASAATIVKVNVSPVTPIITAGGPTAFCAGGSVTLTSSAGSSYLWSNGASTPSINVTTSGSYTVRVTDANGCQSAASVPILVTVNALPVPTISAGGPTTFCDGGSVNLTSSTGTSYLWSTGATTASINTNTLGSYTVRVTDAYGCQSAASAATMVNVNTLPSVNAGRDTTILTGTSTTLNATVTGTGPITYTWSPSSQLADALIEDPITVSLTSTIIFTLTATSTTTSCFNTDAVTITISGGTLSSTPTATPETACAGTNIQLNAIASGGSGIYTYVWTSVPAGFTSSIADPTANPLVNTTYHVAVSDGSTTVNSQVVVTVNALPATPTITAGGPTTFCANGNVTLSSSAGTSHLWSNGENTASINVTTGGSYTVKVKNASGCLSAASAATVVTVNALPVIPTITAGGPTAFCSGGSVTLTSSAGTSYLWSNGATTPGINVAAAGSYTVRVKNASGCQSAASISTIVTVNALPSASITIADNSGLVNNDGIICNGTTATLTASGGTFYSWSSGEITAAIVKGTSGTYTVTVTNANGCNDTKAVNITVNALPIATIGSNSPVCEGDKIDLTSSGGNVYSWSGPNGFTSDNLSDKQNPSIHWASKANAGVYTVTVTATNGCTARKTTSVIVNALPIFIVGSNSPVCEGNTINLISSYGTGYIYRWSGPDDFTSNKQNPSISDASMDMAGPYRVTVSVYTGCAVTKKTMVKINASPLATAGSNGPVCLGNTINLTSSGGTSYSWSGPNGFTSSDQNPTIPNSTILMAGTYTVTAKDATGCSGTSNTNVTFNENPIAFAGPDTLLRFIFKTEMKAKLSPSETGEWSLISGSGHFTDIHSPTTWVNELSGGENIFLWKVRNSSCEASDEVIITVYDPFIPSVITPNGDGKNDYFKIREIIDQDQVELIIFNRWGNEEFTNKNYSNDWDGRNNKGAELPNDTYFYILKFDNVNIKRGSVLIKR